MKSTENKSENDKKAPKQSSTSTRGQKSKQDVKEYKNDNFTKKIIEQNENIQEQLEFFKEIFERQIQMIQTQNQFFETQNNLSKDLKEGIKEMLQKCSDSPNDLIKNEQKENLADKKIAYLLNKDSYRNLAQRNISKKDDIILKVPVNQAYHDRIAEIRSTLEKRKLTN